MGPIENKEFSLLKDATWNEKLAAGVLITGIVAMGVAPFWLNDLIYPGAETIMQRVSEVLK